MKNVIIFAAAGKRYAVELRWVREIITLGPVTPVPGAPVHVAGAVNVRGSIMPVIDLDALFPHAGEPGRVRRRAASRAGEGAVVIDVEGVTGAIQITKVDEVSTVSSQGEPVSDEPALTREVIDSLGRSVPLLDPHELIRVTLAMAHGGHDHLAGRRPAEGAP